MKIGSTPSIPERKRLSRRDFLPFWKSYRWSASTDRR